MTLYCDYQMHQLVSTKFNILSDLRNQKQSRVHISTLSSYIAVNVSFSLFNIRVKTECINKIRKLHKVMKALELCLEETRMSTVGRFY